MEWNMKNNPTFKDISANRSSYFLTVRRHSAFVARDYYNSRLNKWFKTSDCIIIQATALLTTEIGCIRDSVMNTQEIICSANKNG